MSLPAASLKPVISISSKLAQAKNVQDNKSNMYNIKINRVAKNYVIMENKY